MYTFLEKSANLSNKIPWLQCFKLRRGLVFVFQIQKDRSSSLAIALSGWDANVALENHLVTAKGQIRFLTA